MTTQTDSRPVPAEIDVGMPRKSATLGQLAAALAKAQKAMSAVTKDRTAKVTSQKGNYSYHYADLAACMEAVRGPLTDNDLALIQAAGCDGDLVTVTTLLVHKSGEWIEQPLSLRPTQPNAQGVGSAITYARRYGLALVGAVTEEDDDGAEASRAREHYARETVRQVREERHSEPPDDEPPPPPDGADVLTDAQKRTIWQLGKTLGAPADKDAFKAWLSERTGLEVVSLSSMTRPFASRVIDALRRIEAEAGGPR